MVKIAPTIASLGNHDIEAFVNNEWEFAMDEEWVKKLKELPNFMLLSETFNTVKVKNKLISFSAFNPSYH